MAAKPKRVVYTALFGRYEALQEQPEAGTDIDFLCFTDDPELTSETWQIVLVEPEFPLDKPRSVRCLKIGRRHELLADRDESLWIDNRVILQQPASRIFDELLRDSDLTVFRHSFRDTVLQEFDEVVSHGLDEPARVYEQLLHYAETDPGVLELEPWWGGFLLRRWTDPVRDAMGVWLDHVLRYSRRDQLSFRTATRGLERVRVLLDDNRESEWHRWPSIHKRLHRDDSARRETFRTAIRAPLAELTATRAELARLTAELADARAETEAATAEAETLRLAVEDAEVRARASAAELTAQQDLVRGLRDQLDEIHGSLAYRLARRAGNLRGRIRP
jgi:hypothetical protein